MSDQPEVSTSHSRKLAAKRQARHRAKQHTPLADPDDIPLAIDSQTFEIEREQTLWIKSRREISELKRRKLEGELMEVSDAKRQVATLARRIKIALDRSATFLPADIDPTTRAIAAAAMKAAIATALATLTAADIQPAAEST